MSDMNDPKLEKLAEQQKQILAQVSETVELVRLLRATLAEKDEEIARLRAALLAKLSPPPE